MLASALGNAIFGLLQALRALVFDFDGLILDTESSMIGAYADVHADLEARAAAGFR
jgi:beta-phosphoglucomutase-like phosphatase (HAD superfamily)